MRHETSTTTKWIFFFNLVEFFELFVEELCFEDVQKAARILRKSQAVVAHNAPKE